LQLSATSSGISFLAGVPTTPASLYPAPPATSSASATLATSLRSGSDPAPLSPLAEPLVPHLLTAAAIAASPGAPVSAPATGSTGDGAVVSWRAYVRAWLGLADGDEEREEPTHTEVLALLGAEGPAIVSALLEAVARGEVGRGEVASVARTGEVGAPGPNGGVDAARRNSDEAEKAAEEKRRQEPGPPSLRGQAG